MQMDDIIDNQLSARLLDSVRIPRFKIEFHFELIPFLQKMGINKLFSGENRFLFAAIMVSSHCTRPRTRTIPTPRTIRMGSTVICRTLHTAPTPITITIYSMISMGFKAIFSHDFVPIICRIPVATQNLLCFVIFSFCLMSSAD